MENKNQKDTRMYLRVTQSDKKQIVRLAEICGLSQSEYLRQRALGFAPRAVLPDVFFDFNQTLCRLCDEVADNGSPEVEQQLLEVVNQIQNQLILPGKSTTKQIQKEVAEWQPPDSGPSRDD